MKNSQMVTVKELSDKKCFNLCKTGNKKADFSYEKVSLRNNCIAGSILFFFLFIILCAVSIIKNNFLIEILTLICFAGEVLCCFKLYFQLSDSKKYAFRGLRY